jgi:Holliday junction resolvase RusA-like endonuclease
MAWVRGEVIRIEVPGPPRAWKRSGHRLIRPAGKKPFISTFTQTATRDAQAEFKDCAQRAMNRRPPIDGPVELRMASYIPVPPSWSQKKQRMALADQLRPTSKPDYDNYAKMIDALKGVVWRDDCLVTDGSHFKRYSDRPRLVVEVRSLTWSEVGE